VAVILRRVTGTGFAQGQAGKETKAEKLESIAAKVETGELVVRNARGVSQRRETVNRHRREKRTAALGQPADFSDLELSPAEEMLERAETRRLQANGVRPAWTADQLDRLRRLLRLGDGAAWSVGDAVLSMVEMGESKAANGALARLGELAQAVGAEVATLRRARSVAHAWPAASRVDGLSMAAHGSYTLGGPAKADERGTFLRRLAAEHGGTLSADQVREARGLKRCRELRDPVRSVLGRVDRCHRVLQAFPVERPTNGRATPAILLRRAEQAREIADRLEALAA
jgi:hypothetical protein